MKRLLIAASVAFIGGVLSPAAANAAQRTDSYSVIHAKYGTIGTYDRVSDTTDGVTHAQAHLKIAVKVLGLVVRRETSDQTELWRGQRLMSFQSLTITNGSRLAASGAVSGDHFLVSSPQGVAVAPADVVASDPWSLNRLGPVMVVSTRSGAIYSVQVTGGEADKIKLPGGVALTRHYHVNTAAQPDKWEVWVDRTGVPVKFRTVENGAAIDFVLSSSTTDDFPSHLAQGGANGAD